MKKNKISLLWKLLIAIASAAVMAGGFYFYSTSGKTKTDTTRLVQQYRLLNDSLDNFNFRMLEDSSPEKQKLYIDQIHFLQIQITSLRKEIQSSQGAIDPNLQALPVKPLDAHKNHGALNSLGIDQSDLWYALGLVGLILFFGIAYIALKIFKKHQVSQRPLASLQDQDSDWDDYRPPTIRPKVQRASTRVEMNHREGESPFPPPPPPRDRYESMAEDPLDRYEASVPPSPAHSETIFEMPTWDEEIVPPSPAPTSPTAAPTPPWQDNQEIIKQDVVKLARRGFTSSEIAKRMRVSQDKVEFILRIHREKGL